MILLFAIILASTILTATAADDRIYIFDVPSHECPAGLDRALKVLYNEQRETANLPPLSLRESLSDTALDLAWAAKHGDSAPANITNVAFQVMALSYNTQKEQIIRVLSEVFSQLQKRGRKPKFIDADGEVQVVSDKQWKKTRKMGVACLVREYPQRSGLYIAVAFELVKKRSGEKKRKNRKNRKNRHRNEPRNEHPQSEAIKFTVPTLDCPHSFTESLLSHFNAQRRIHSLHEFKSSMLITQHAQNWTLTAQDDAEDAPNTPEYGQLNWNKWWDSSLVDHFEINPNEPFRLKWDTEISIPMYRSIEEGRRRLHWNDWKEIRFIGVGCSMRNRKRGRREIIVFHVAVFFQYEGKLTPSLGGGGGSGLEEQPAGPIPQSCPTQMCPEVTCPPPPTCPTTPPPPPSPSNITTVHFTVPTNHCPAKFSKAILAKLNQQRHANQAPPYRLSTRISEEAQLWATNAPLNISEKVNLTAYGQLNWLQWWHSTLLSGFDVSSEDPFRLKWEEELSMPIYTGEGGSRLYRWSEWLDSKAIGIGCSMSKPIGYLENVVMLHVAVFFEYKDTKEAPSTTENIKTAGRYNIL